MGLYSGIIVHYLVIIGVIYTLVGPSRKKHKLQEGCERFMELPKVYIIHYFSLLIGAIIYLIALTQTLIEDSIFSEMFTWSWPFIVTAVVSGLMIRSRLQKPPME